ncbi:hypothetical protein HanRHA438_Chr17g0818551 [Helianthus annuus]|nr:hypothetical protein HanRHA438_Chr17g0818551 [Helianthus annuus]
MILTSLKYSRNWWWIRGRPYRSSASEAFLFLPPLPLAGALGIEAVGLAGIRSFFLEDRTLSRSVTLNLEADFEDFPAPAHSKQDKYPYPISI